MSDPTRDDPWVARAALFPNPNYPSYLTGNCVEDWVLGYMAAFAKAEVARALREVAAIFDTIAGTADTQSVYVRAADYLRTRAHAVEDGHE